MSWLPGRRSLAAVAAGVVVAMVAAYLMLSEGDRASAAPGAVTASEGEIAAGLLAVAPSYPGGLAGLLGLFSSGECAGVPSYEEAPPPCRSILDRIAQAGAGQPYPERIPDLGRPIDPSDPPPSSPDPSDRLTPEMIDEMERQGAPADLIAGLRQDPPYLPPAYNTLPHYMGGPGTASVPTFPTHTETTVPTEPTEPTSTESTVPTEPTEPTETTEPTSDPTTTTDPTDTTTDPTDTTTTGPTEPTSTESTVPTTEPTETTTTYPSPTWPTTTYPTTQPTPPTTTTQPPPAEPPLLVAVGDSVTSGHEARGFGVWRTTCDDPGTGPAAPGSSWAGLLRGMIGVPWNRYFNFAHSGANTTNVRITTPYTNPCGVVSQPAVSQLNDARAVLMRWPSRPNASNVAVITAGINDTNWVGVATQLVGRHDWVIGQVVGRAPAWSVTNRQSCIDWALGNPAGNPAAPPGAIAPAWNGAAVSGGISAGVTQIALGLITADPGAQVRQAYYYHWLRDPNLPAVCTGAALRATTMLNDWVALGILVAKIAWAFAGGNPNRIDVVCNQVWNPAPNFIQTRLISFGIPNWAVVPGWPHPNAGGRAALAGCVNGTLPRAPGGGIA